MTCPGGRFRRFTPDTDNHTQVGLSSSDTRDLVSTVKTLAEAYALRHPQAPDRFDRVLFNSTLHRPAWLLYPLLCRTSYFEIDHELIHDCAHARSMQELQEYIEDYAYHPRNGGILRNWLRIRISIRKVRHFARKYFAYAAEHEPHAVAKGLRIDPRDTPRHPTLPVRGSTLHA